MKISIAALGLSLAAAAHADMLKPVGPNGSLTPALSWSAAGMGTESPATLTGNLNDPAQGVTVNDLSGNPASNYGFANSFPAANGAFASGTLQVQGQAQQYNFVDTYIIDAPTSLASAYVFSLNLTEQLGIQNLTARFYSYSAGGVQNLTIGGTGAVTGPVVSPWSADSNVNGVTSTQLLATGISSGEYVLQIAGLETGTQSGMYNGSLAITPVPLPAGLPLLLSAAGGLGLWGRRRR
jgi:hypothetical protein